MFIADLHIHSKYSRATSKDCVPEMLELWARKKGLGLIGTGDFTHRAWREELKEKLITDGDGLYRLRPEFEQDSGTGAAGPVRFVVSGEISSIYKKNGRVRKVHNLILLPGLEEAEALSRRLEEIGNLHSDGRPILGLDSRDLLEIALTVCPESIFIPAHIWTPHFSMFGAYSGFESVEECFGDLTGHIHALETGLSSNPAMNVMVSQLDRYTLVSNSDAHSPGNLAREANLFDTELAYSRIARALERPEEGFRGTIEFFPEEGKYHYDGHRNCKVCQSPAETIEAAGVCPVCGGKVTVGVLHRVEELADRDEGAVRPDMPPYESLIPLPEVLAACTGFSPKSQKGRAIYDRLLRELGPELPILREIPPEEVERVAGPAVAEGIRRLRSGQVKVSPGYDGEYGTVGILEPGEIEELAGQLRFFLALEGKASGGKKTASPKKKRPAQVGRAAGGNTGKRESLSPKNALEGLSEEQRQAAFSPARTTAVIAGPGTGKTKTLVARIAWLVERCGVPPAAIVAVTFTNKAAGEMRARLESHFGGREAVEAMTIGTFHGICLQALERAGESGAILDESAARLLVEDLRRERGVTLSAGKLLREMSLRKCGVPAPQEDELPEGFLEAYKERLREYGALDYDDILLRALERKTDIFPVDTGAEGASVFHLLVDEFQDCNPVQYNLVQLWGERCRTVFVIGDPDQSIYGFRGSDPHCFDRLRQDNPAMGLSELSVNYRSTREILEASASVLAEGKTRTAQRGGGADVRLIGAESPFSEAVFIAKAINRMVGGMDMLESGSAQTDGGRGFSDFAVLYRTNRQAAVLEECLAKEGIPYVASGREDFLRLPETAETLAFFRLLLHPGDRLSLRVCLERLAGCGAAELAEIRAAWDTERTIESLSALRGLLGSVKNGGKGMEDFQFLLERYEKSVGRAKPKTLLTRWVEERGLAETEWADKLLRTAVFHDNMRDFLQAVTLGQEADLRRYGGKRHTGDAVLLTTLHGAKGLEFPVVFLAGAGADQIPGKRFGGALEEERRLLYVGMTRAMDELILLHSGEISPYLENLPGECARQEARPERSGEYRQYSLFRE